MQRALGSGRLMVETREMAAGGLTQLLRSGQYGTISRPGSLEAAGGTVAVVAPSVAARPSYILRTNYR